MGRIGPPNRYFCHPVSFYNELFNDVTQGEAVKGELLAMLGALDKIYCQGKGKGRVFFEDAMLFALLLFPWALRHFDLLNQELKGPVYHRLSKSIRGELDQVFARRLNLKRAIKDNITTLFVNMSSLQKNCKNDTWPAWLRKRATSLPVPGSTPCTRTQLPGKH